MIKKFFVSQMLKIKVEKKMRGKIVFRVNSLKQANEEYAKYERFLHEALKKLDGVNQVVVDKSEGLVVVTYDEKKLEEAKLLKWVEILREVGIDNYELIEKYGEKDLEYVVKVIEKQLDDKLKKM